jgi:uroporphyrinogen-III decarboxylase
MLPVDLYRAFAADPLKTVIERFHDVGAIVAVHMCGQTEHLIGDLIASGADILEVDSPVDIPNLARRYGRPASWLGNIHPVDVVMKGPPARIRTVTRGLLEAMGRGPGFILSTGCEPSILTPVDHVQAFLEAVREFNAAGEVGESVPHQKV